MIHEFWRGAQYVWVNILKNPIIYLHFAFFHLIWKSELLFEPDAALITYITLH